MITQITREEVKGMFKVELGSTVKDKITGYEGLVIGRHEYLYGCRRYSVQSQVLKDGKPVESLSADEDQLEVLVQASPQVIKDTGGPRDEPARRQDPKR